MVLTGGYAEQPRGGLRVKSQGSGPSDGWQRVLEFPDTELPAGTNRDGCFIVSGVMGNSASGGASAALLEVGVRVAGRATPYQFCQVQAVQGMTLGTRAIPFHFVLMFQGSGSLGAYSPTGTERLEVVARVFRNGDPPSISTEFDVTATRLTFWDLDRLGASNWHYHGQQFITATMPSASSGFGTIGAASQSLPTGTAENWMVYAAAQFRPANNLEYPTLRVSEDTGSSVGPLFDIGGVRRTNGARQDYLALGGLRVLVVNGGATKLVLQGVDGHNGTQSTVHRADFFSVRLGALAASHVIQKANTDPTREKLLNDHNAGTPSFLQWEPTLSGVTGNMMFAGYMRAPELTFQSQSWTHFLTFGTRAVYWSERHLVSGPDGSVGVIGMGRLPAFNKQDPRTYQLGQSNPAEAAAGTSYYAEDQCSVAFVFEDDPTVFDRSSRPADPPTVIVVPGREASLNLDEVAVLPFEPTDYTYSDDPGEDVEFTSDMGYVTTWPRLSKPRQRHTLPFRLGEADRNTLIAFLNDAPGRVFTWTPPEAGAAKKMFRIDGDIGEAMADLGAGPGSEVLWDITVPCVELVWFGSS